MKDEFITKLVSIAERIGYPKNKIRDIISNLEASDYVSLKNALSNKNLDEVKQILNKSLSSVTMESVIFENELLGVDDETLIKVQSMNKSELYEAYQQIPYSSIGVNLLDDKSLRTLVYINEDIISTTQPKTSSVAPLPQTPAINTKVNATQQPVKPVGTSNSTNATKVNTTQQVTNPIGGTPGPEVNSTMNPTRAIGSNNPTAQDMTKDPNAAHDPEAQNNQADQTQKQELNGVISGTLGSAPNQENQNVDNQENQRLAQLAGVHPNTQNWG